MIQDTICNNDFISECKKVELLVNDNQFAEALNTLSPMFNNHKFVDNNDFLCKLFDLYLQLNSYNEAEVILNSIKLNCKNKTDEENYQTRLALLNTMENLKYNLTISNFNSSVASLNDAGMVIPDVIKGKELSRYKIEVDLHKDENITFVVECCSSHNEKPHLNVLPHKVVSEKSCKYEIIVNILYVKKNRYPER